ncbi:MAG: tryptophan--tRNA ligase, partial [Chloroflexi bacterium]|nr:tryptophan--tRNA ligase [Chloroflexota bacterium]
PETCNVFTLYSLFASEAERAELTEKYRGGKIGYGDAKKLLLGTIEEYFATARQRRAALVKDPGYVEEVLARGARRARETASVTMRLVREAVGMKASPVV